MTLSPANDFTVRKDSLEAGAILRRVNLNRWIQFGSALRGNQELESKSNQTGGN